MFPLLSTSFVILAQEAYQETSRGIDTDPDPREAPRFA